MDNLQDAYRDDDDDVVSPQTTTTTTTTRNVSGDADPKPDPMALDPITEEQPTEVPIPEKTTVVIAAESPYAGPEEPKPDEPIPETEVVVAEPLSTGSEEPKPETEVPKPEPMSLDPALMEVIAAELDQSAVGLPGKAAEGVGSEDVSSGSLSEDEQTNVPESSEKKEEETQGEEEEEEEDDGVAAENGGGSGPGKKAKTKVPGIANGGVVKKSSKKKSKNSNSVWTKTTRKSKKKAKNFAGGGNSNNHNGAHNAVLGGEDTVKITPLPRFPDKNDDTPDGKICLSKAHKAEKVDVSEDRMSAGSCKGYRMVRATRGVCDGAWYFEIKVVSLGETGHTRLGWSTEKGDLQAPVGYDGCSYGYRDVDGSKVHKALREKYGEEGYKEGDVIGCYISLPDGEAFAPKPPHLVWYKGQKYVCNNDSKEDPPKTVPGSEISFFRNGVCQGVAFKDLCGGRYYPAASMYTLPNQPNCVVKFNFGPDFDCFPADFDGRPVPRPMIEVPYHGYDSRAENGVLDESQQ